MFNDTHIKIRRYAADDMDALVSFGRWFCIEIDKKFNEPIYRDHVDRMHHLGVVLVAEDNHRVIGVVNAFETQNNFTGAKVLCLGDIFVDPDYRDKGVARALMKHLKTIGEALKFDEYSWELESRKRIVKCQR